MRGNSAGGPAVEPAKRRRNPPSQLTAKACLHCRTVKHKCDGEKPVCGRCRRTGTECDWGREHAKRGPKPRGPGAQKSSEGSGSLPPPEGTPPLDSSSDSGPRPIGAGSSPGLSGTISPTTPISPGSLLTPELSAHLLLTYCTEIQPEFPLLHLPTLVSSFGSLPEELRTAVLLCAASKLEARGDLPHPNFSLADTDVRTWSDVLLPRLVESLPTALMATDLSQLRTAVQTALVLLFSQSTSHAVSALGRRLASCGYPELARERAQTIEGRKQNALGLRIFSLVVGVLGEMGITEHMADTADWIEAEEWRRIWLAILIFDRATTLDLQIAPRVTVPRTLRVPCFESSSTWMRPARPPPLLRDVSDSLVEGGEAAVQTWNSLPHTARVLLLFDLCCECAIASDGDIPSAPDPLLLARLLLLQSADAGPPDPQRAYRAQLLRTALMYLLIPRPAVQAAAGLLHRAQVSIAPREEVEAGEVRGLEALGAWVGSGAHAAAEKVADAVLAGLEEAGWACAQPGAGMFAVAGFLAAVFRLARARLSVRGLGGLADPDVSLQAARLAGLGKADAARVLSWCAARASAEVRAWEWGIKGAGRSGLPGYGTRMLLGSDSDGQFAGDNEEPIMVEALEVDDWVEVGVGGATYLWALS
ncbi:hypothetical protein DFJ74DRAFT_488752 [Hyaloraphidium curvatum]|nr:hypothetical protein DFJ74DRAFT_488752 [Hyaloraphidium curvatum]